MPSQDLIETLKLFASISTPVAVAVSGILINRTIQRQNAKAQRESSWLVKWSDDFLKIASEFNDSATEFLMVYWWLSALQTNPSLKSDEMALRNDNLVHYRALVLSEWRMLKFADLAIDSGKSLEKAAKALVEEAGNWAKNGGGSVPLFREKQAVFNKSVRRVHAELLGLGSSKKR